VSDTVAKNVALVVLGATMVALALSNRELREDVAELRYRLRNVEVNWARERGMADNVVPSDYKRAQCAPSRRLMFEPAPVEMHGWGEMVRVQPVERWVDAEK
jgi:hypothetical protein